MLPIPAKVCVEIVLCVFCVTLPFTRGVQNVYDNISLRLFKHLFDGDYSPKIIPLCIDHTNVTVNIDLALRELVELNEKFQLIRLKIWLRLKWTDCSLRWNASEFGGTEYIIVPHDTIWVPDITLYEGLSDEANMPGKTDYFAEIRSDGRIMYNFPTIITAACRIDVTFFPYDYQNCSVTLGSWIYHGNLIDLSLVNPSADIDNFVNHNEWDLISMKSIKHVKFYNCCPEPYPTVAYHVHLARFPKFYLLTVFVPCVIISVLSLMGFVLPPVSGDKIAIQITVLLSIVVFLLLVQDKLPSSSETFPYLGVYFMTAMCLVSLSCTMSGIIMYIYYRDITGLEVPYCVRKVFLGYIRKLLCVKLTTGDDRDKEFNGAVVVKEIQSLDGEKIANGECAKLHHGRTSIRKNSTVVTSKNDIPTLKEPDKDLDPGPRNHAKHFVTNEWELLAYVLDRLFMIIYIILTLVNICSFLLLMGDELHRFWIILLLNMCVNWSLVYNLW